MLTAQNNYITLAPKNSLDRTAKALLSHNYEPLIVETKEEALEAIKSLIPRGASVMNGTSQTLREIGFVDYLKSGDHGWNNLHAPIVAEPDRAKQQPMRNAALFADYYLGSAHAVTETGEMIIASNSGSQLPHLVYTSPNLILVVGIQKIVPSRDAAFDRIQEHVIPLEDERMKGVYGIRTTHAKTVILHRENPMSGRKIRVILVKEKLGF
jgi:L-lactate utilization protein LutC